MFAVFCDVVCRTNLSVSVVHTVVHRPVSRCVSFVVRFRSAAFSFCFCASSLLRFCTRSMLPYTLTTHKFPRPEYEKSKMENGQWSKTDDEARKRTTNNTNEPTNVPSPPPSNNNNNNTQRSLHFSYFSSFLCLCCYISITRSWYCIAYYGTSSSLIIRHQGTRQGGDG